MAMNRPPQPGPPQFSPRSMNSSDSYGFPPAPHGGAARPPPPNSPPGSNHPSGSTASTEVSRPSVSGSSFNRPPSSASSVARSSDGRMGFGGPASRDSGRSTFKPDMEDQLQRHYHVLKGFLSASLRDEKGNIKPNKARDKLLRLSVTQFMELSTDVYDELVRREDERLGRVPNVPRSLPPKQTFHPKRNQARQKLSTLPVERFKQLATDVFYELERRIPRFAGGDIDRPMSTSSNRSRAQSRAGGRPPGPPGPPGAYRGPPSGPGRPPMGPNGMPPPNAPYQSFRPASPGAGQMPARPPTGSSESSSFGRPLPKTFQSNTIVPNKSTMVEDDDVDDGEAEDAFGLEKSLSGISNERFSKATSPGVGSAEDKEKIQAQEAEIQALKERLEKAEGSTSDRDQEMTDLREGLQQKEVELDRIRSDGQGHEDRLTSERGEWKSLQEELERKHLDAQQLNESLQRELDQLKMSKESDESGLRSVHEVELESLRTELGNSHRITIGDLRAQLDNVHDQTDDLHQQLQTHQAENEELRAQLQNAQQLQTTSSNGSEEQSRRIELLETELANQEKLTNDVRDEAMMYLQEMRDLSRQNDQAIEEEERLVARVSQLEREIEQWRQRYAKVKAQNKSLRASTMGLNLAAAFDSGSLVRKEGVMHEAGLVRDVDVTRFQMSVDELLKVARHPATEPMLESVKGVVLCVQSITSAVGTDGYPTPSPSPMSPSGQRTVAMDSASKLKARVTGTANSLITATKQHASSLGLSPVALLDAAASNLTASVVELIKAVGIKPSPKHELASDDDDSHENNLLSDHHRRMESFYDDTLSPAEAGFSVGVSSPSSTAQIHSPSPPASTLSQPHHQTSSSPASEPPKPAPLNVLGRSNTTKKTNGWFGGWGRKASVDETPAPVTPTINGNAAQAAGGDGEYDPYR